MIDAELKIFNAVRPYVVSLCATNGFKSVYTPTPSAFPTVCLYEMDNATVRKRQSSTPGENFATITYEAQIYAQTKAECRQVFAALDEAMILLGFNRFSGQFIPNADNTKVFRYVARYEAEIDVNGVIYRKP